MTIIISIFKVLVCTIITFSLLHILLSYFIAFCEWRCTAQRENKRLPIFKMIKSFLQESVLTFLAPITSLTMFYHFKAKNNGKTPILLVHGYIFNQSAWLYIRHGLEKADTGPVYSLNLHPPFTSIENITKSLSKKIAEIEEETGTDKLILIGHSMGGIVSSYYAECIAAKDSIQGVITLGSPLQGSRLTAIGIGKNCTQMTPHSPFLQDLEKKRLASTIPYYNVASKLDNMIVPWDSALASKNIRDQYILDDLGHLSLLVSPKIVSKIIQWLKDKKGWENNGL